MANYLKDNLYQWLEDGSNVCPYCGLKYWGDRECPTCHPAIAPSLETPRRFYGFLRAEIWETFFRKSRY